MVGNIGSIFSYFEINGKFTNFIGFWEATCEHKGNFEIIVPYCFGKGLSELFNIIVYSSPINYQKECPHILCFYWNCMLRATIKH